LELPTNQVVTRHITVPSKATEFLQGIVRNQIDRISPWPQDQAAYGFEACLKQDDAASLDVRVSITSRTNIDAVQAEISSLGLRLDQIVSVSNEASQQPITLWTRAAAELPKERIRMRHFLAAGIAGCVLLSAVISGWAFMSAASIRDQNDDLENHAKKFERQLHGARSDVTGSLSDPLERAWSAKQSASTMVILLEGISQALPDTAYLTNLEFERTRVRLIGVAPDPPSLIAPLEQSGYLSDVHFFAPMTRGADPAQFRFNIEAQVKPGLDLKRRVSDADPRP
jgi:general secretion pathway protein L